MAPDREATGATEGSDEEDAVELEGKRVLALGTRGAQGTGLEDALLARGAVPVLGSSDSSQVAAWRAAGRAAAVTDLREPDTLREAAAHADAVALHWPLSVAAPRDVEALYRSVGAARESGVAVAVNLGLPVPPPDVPDVFGVRDRIAALAALGAAIVAPTAYLENHAAPWSLDSLRGGRLVYPRPAQDPLAWIAAKDVTAALAAALEADVQGEVLQLAGPQALTFEQLAAELGAGLGRDIAFERVTPEQYGELLRPVLGVEAAAGVAGAYAQMPERPNPAMTPDAARVWERLGLQPRTAREWATTDLAPLLQRVQ